MHSTSVDVQGRIAVRPFDVLCLPQSDKHYFLPAAAERAAGDFAAPVTAALRFDVLSGQVRQAEAVQRLEVHRHSCRCQKPDVASGRCLRFREGIKVHAEQVPAFDLHAINLNGEHVTRRRSLAKNIVGSHEASLSAAERQIAQALKCPAVCFVFRTSAPPCYRGRFPRVSGIRSGERTLSGNSVSHL